MNINLPLNEMHKELERLHLAGASAKLNGFTVKEIADCCSLKSSLVNRIWNRLVLLISKGVWASDAAISKHLFYNVLWVNSKAADGLLKGSFEEKEKLNQVIEKVIDISKIILNDNIGFISRYNFLDNSPLRFFSGNVQRNLSNTQQMIHSENPREYFYSNAEGALKWGKPVSFFVDKPQCYFGYFNLVLFPYNHYLESKTHLSATTYAKENIQAVCTKNLQLSEIKGTIDCS